MNYTIEQIKEISINNANKNDVIKELKETRRRMRIINKLERLILKNAERGKFEFTYDFCMFLPKEQCELIDKYFTSNGYECKTIEGRIYYGMTTRTTIKWK